MKLQVLAVLLLSGACLASEGQGIDEEKIYPDWNDEIHYEPVNFLSDDDMKYPLVPEELNLEKIFAEDQTDIVIKLNKAVDKILGFVRDAFGPLGEFGIPLPDVSKPFGKPPYGGTFKASRGYFKNPASLERTGDVEIIVKSGTTITLEVQLGFKEAEAGFKQYNLDVLNIHHEGTITATVAENSVTLKLTLTYAPSCSFHLDELKFDKLEGVKINITGLGVFQTMFNQLSYWLINNFESTFRDIINKTLYDTANKALENKDICKYFPH